MFGDIDENRPEKVWVTDSLREQNILTVKSLKSGDKIILADGSKATFNGAGLFPGHLTVKERPCESIPADKVRT